MVACNTNPNPIVKILSMSLSTTALANSNNNPAHINNTTSKLGVWSLTPFNYANNVGIVAQ